MLVRVAHVITRMIVGGAQETAMLACALADRSRFDPVLVTGPQTGPEGSLLQACAQRGVRVVLVPELVREVSPLTDARGLRALVRVLRELRPDVVQTHSSKAGVLGRVAARRAGVPRVLHTVHGWPFHDAQPPPVSLVWKGLERACAPLAERLLVVAEADRVKGLVAGIGRPEQYALVRSGIELDAYAADPGVRAAVRDELGLPQDALVIGAVNRLSAQKDPLTLAAAARQVLQARPDARLLLVGDGPLRPDVERALAGVPGVVLTGLRTDVPRLLAAMDVFVSASRWEGLPRTLLQATAAGLPLVCTAADGVVDLVQDGVTGLLVPRQEPQALAAALLRLVDDPALRGRLAAAAAERLGEFDARRMVDDYQALWA